MRCPACNAGLGHINAAGEPMIRARGLVLKAEGVVAICPKCKGSVPLAGDLAKALGARLLLPAKQKKQVVPKKADRSARS